MEIRAACGVALVRPLEEHRLDIITAMADEVDVSVFVQLVHAMGFLGCSRTKNCFLPAEQTWRSKCRRDEALSLRHGETGVATRQS